MALFVDRDDLREMRGKIKRYGWARALYRRVAANGSKPRVGRRGPCVDDPLSGLGRIIRDRALMYAISGDGRQVEAIVESLRAVFVTDDLSRPLEGCGVWSYGLRRYGHVWAFDLLANVQPHRALRGSFRSKLARRFEEILTAQRA